MSVVLIIAENRGETEYDECQRTVTQYESLPNTPLGTETVCYAAVDVFIESAHMQAALVATDIVNATRDDNRAKIHHTPMR
jgi:hypothetical protein